MSKWIIAMLALSGFVLSGAPDKAIRVACIGDSITYGSGIADREATYPATLQRLLGDGYEVRNFGDPGRGVIRSSRRGNGWRAYGKQTIHERALAFAPHVVICNLGINDVDAWRAGHQAEFTPNYLQLLAEYQALPTKPKIFIWTKLAPITKAHRCFGWQEPFLMRAALSEVAAASNAIALDLFSPLAYRDNLFSPDGIHPNAAGAKRIAEATHEQIRPHLTGNFGGLQLPYVFTDHMVLQRQRPIPIWGTADAGRKITVTLADTTATTIADARGRWRVELPAMPAGGPCELRIAADRTIRCRDVLIGDLWLAAGQSNMRWFLKHCAAANTEIPQANHPRIRLLNRVGAGHPGGRPWDDKTLSQCTPELFYSGRWQPCTPDSAAEFSGVAYFFAKRLQAELDVPVGIINPPIGGTIAEAFTSTEALLNNPTLRSLVARNDGWLNSPLVPPWPKERARLNLRHWLKAPTAAIPHHPFEPGFLFDAAIRPITNLPIRGVIWYQGESNATTGGQPDLPLDQTYVRAGLETLIADWRQQFRQPDLPFLMVQLPNLNRPWMQFREIQLQTHLATPHTGLVTTIDVGDPRDVHPRRKQPVGDRLATVALSVAYGRPTPPSGPIPGEVSFTGSTARIAFSRTASLHWQNGHRVRGFELAGPDGVFHPAAATIVNTIIIAHAPAVPRPTTVRYAWHPNPDANLIGSSGLPASPFRANHNNH